MLMEWLKKAPTPIVVTILIIAGFGFLAMLGGFVALDLAGQDTTDYRTFINTLANLIMLPLMGLGTVASVAAARSSSKTEEQTNGQLTTRDETIADHEQTIAQLQAMNTSLARRQKNGGPL